MNVKLHCVEREVKGIFLFSCDFTLQNYFYTISVKLPCSSLVTLCPLFDVVIFCRIFYSVIKIRFLSRLGGHLSEHIVSDIRICVRPIRWTVTDIKLNYII